MGGWYSDNPPPPDSGCGPSLGTLNPKLWVGHIRGFIANNTNSLFKNLAWDVYENVSTRWNKAQGSCVTEHNQRQMLSIAASCFIPFCMHITNMTKYGLLLLVLCILFSADALTGELSTRIFQKLFDGQRGVNQAADDYAFDYVNHKVASFQSRYVINNEGNMYEELHIIEDITKVGSQRRPNYQGGWT